MPNINDDWLYLETRYDSITAQKMEAAKQQLRGVDDLKIHVPHVEDSAATVAVVMAFLDKHPIQPVKTINVSK